VRRSALLLKKYRIELAVFLHFDLCTHAVMLLCNKYTHWCLAVSGVVLKRIEAGVAGAGDVTNCQ
jgi:hypothetical protein